MTNPQPHDIIVIESEESTKESQMKPQFCTECDNSFNRTSNSGLKCRLTASIPHYVNGRIDYKLCDEIRNLPKCENYIPKKSFWQRFVAGFK